MSRSMHRRLAPAVLALAAALVLPACSMQEAGFDGDESPADSAEPTSETDPTDPEDDAAGGEDSGDRTADADPSVDADPQTVDPGEVIAEATYALPGSSEGSTVTVGVRQLTVEGSTMILELVLTPNGSGSEADASWMVYDLAGGARLEPVLNDRSNLKQYILLNDSSGGTDSSQDWATDTGPGAPRVTSGETTVWWGYYAAPEDDIDAISVSVLPGAVELADVPIER